MFGKQAAEKRSARRRNIPGERTTCSTIRLFSACVYVSFEKKTVRLPSRPRTSDHYSTSPKELRVPSGAPLSLQSYLVVVKSRYICTPKTTSALHSRGVQLLRVSHPLPARARNAHMGHVQSSLLPFLCSCPPRQTSGGEISGRCRAPRRTILSTPRD